MTSVSFRRDRNERERVLDVSDELVAVRTVDKRPVTDPSNFQALPRRCRDVIKDRFRCVASAPHAGVQVFRSTGGQDTAFKDAAAMLADHVRIVSPVLTQPRKREPWVPTANIDVLFRDDVSRHDAARVLMDHGLHIRRVERLCKDWYLCSVPESEPLHAFDLASSLYDDSRVVHSYPELIRRKALSGPSRLQWHLYEATFHDTVIDAHVHAEEAWDAGYEGEGTTIALIDDGFDSEHEAFRQLDSGAKIVSPVMIEGGVISPGGRPAGPHGTRCGGVACANRNDNVSGVAPRSRIMPIGLGASELHLGSLDECLAFKHAVDAGADVISCSWNPKALPYELTPMAEDAIRYATDMGRSGKGSVVIFSAGNGGLSMDEDGYAAHQKVIAVGACDGQNRRWARSNFGQTLWCCAPGHHAISMLADEAIRHGIYTTDPMGTVGVNGDYFGYFYGTSAAAPIVAGVAALILGANPELTAQAVKTLIGETCEKIARTADDNPYDADGHSEHYGFGRVDAAAAATMAESLDHSI